MFLKLRKMKPAIKIAIAVFLILVLIVGGIFVFKKISNGGMIDPNKGQVQVNPNPPVERPPHKISYLFRDGILGKPETDVCEVLDITSDEIIYENILGKNMETTFKWKSGNLEAMYSTVEVTAGIPYDYAREHQVLLDEIIASCDYSPRSSGVIWGDGLDKKFSSTIWNEALNKGSLILYDEFELEEGSVVLITSNYKYDDAIERSRSENIFQTVIVSTKEYIDKFIDELPDITINSVAEQSNNTSTETTSTENTSNDNSTNSKPKNESGVQGVVQ